MSMAILFVENDTQYREVISRVLRDANYEVYEASTASEALSILSLSRVDLTVIDKRLENDEDVNDISGLELAKAPELRYIPTILLSGHDMSLPEINETLTVSANELPVIIRAVSKAESPTQIIDTIEEVLNLWPSLRTTFANFSNLLKDDYNTIRQQAQTDYRFANESRIVGFVFIFIGIILAWFEALDLSIAIIVTSSGILFEMITYLFFRRLDHSNERMDLSRKELYQIYWLELLVAHSERLPRDKEISLQEELFRQAARGHLGPQLIPNANTSSTNSEV